MKVRISERALVQRINRKLAAQNEVLKKTRGAHAFLDLGDYYVLDARHRFVLHKEVDPVALGKELGVLKGYETVEG